MYALDMCRKAAAGTRDIDKDKKERGREREREREGGGGRRESGRDS
jgi:hypothetical protein